MGKNQRLKQVSLAAIFIIRSSLKQTLYVRAHPRVDSFGFTSRHSLPDNFVMRCTLHKCLMYSNVSSP